MKESYPICKFFCFLGCLLDRGHIIVPKSPLFYFYIKFGRGAKSNSANLVFILFCFGSFQFTAISTLAALLAEVVWGYFLTSAALVARGAAGVVIYVLCCHFFDFTAKVTVGVTNVAPLVARVIVNMFSVWMLPFCNQCNIGMFYGDSFKVPIGAFPAPADELIAYPCRITGRLKDVSKTDFSFKRIFLVDLERNSNLRTVSGKTNCQQSEAKC